MDIANFQLFARYNTWATKRLTECLDQISDEDFHKDNGLFFKSIFAPSIVYFSSLNNFFICKMSLISLFV